MEDKDAVCVWKKVPDVWADEAVLWESACGIEWCIEEDNPTDMGYYYCPNCGRRINVLRGPERGRNERPDLGEPKAERV